MIARITRGRWNFAGADRIVRAMTTTWRPVLHGADAVRARTAIADVAAALANPDPAWRVDASLANGDAGLAVFYAYLGDTDVAVGFVERAIDAVAANTMSPSLHHGFTGVAWAIEHLVGRVIEPGDDLVGSIDDALAELPVDLDLMNGVVGIGVYALERRARPLLERVVARLVAEPFPWTCDGEVNLGLAHGVPGMIAMLAAALDVAPGRALLDEAVRWLLALPRPFGDVVGDTRPARLGWCYGDVAIASALVLAGTRAGIDAWTRAGLELARSAAARTDDTGVRDACVCHGAAGLGLMFARLAQHDPSLADPAARWYRAALDLQVRGGPVGGFAPFVIDRELALGDASVGLLTGAAGVALALHAAITPDEPAWDRALLLSAH